MDRAVTSGDAAFRVIAPNADRSCAIRECSEVRWVFTGARLDFIPLATGAVNEPEQLRARDCDVIHLLHKSISAVAYTVKQRSMRPIGHRAGFRSK